MNMKRMHTVVREQFLLDGQFDWSDKTDEGYVENNIEKNLFFNFFSV